jgi:OOP family OmpA-OmpF porin
MRTTKYTKVLTGLFMMFCIGSNAQIDDVVGCKDHSLFNRMPNTFITECSENFDLVEIYLSQENKEFKEGKKTYIGYTYNYDSNVKPPSFYEIVKNYENAILKKGGKKIFYGPPYEIGMATLYLKTGEKEIWISIANYNGIGDGQYGLTILEIEAMKQEIIANEILDALNKDGFIALYLNFSTGKSTIEPESDIQIDEIVSMMKNNPSLKISIEGHTDNVGGDASNQTLSEDRAKAVMMALIAKGIDKSRLVAKGWGASKPISDNRTEDGRTKNRRVEIVKL